MPNESVVSMQTTGDGVPVMFEHLSDDAFDRLMEQAERSFAGRKSAPLSDIYREMESLLAQN